LRSSPPVPFSRGSLKARRRSREVKRSGTECGQRATAQISVAFPVRDASGCWLPLIRLSLNCASRRRPRLCGRCSRGSPDRASGIAIASSADGLAGIGGGFPQAVPVSGILSGGASRRRSRNSPSRHMVAMPTVFTATCMSRPAPPVRNRRRPKSARTQPAAKTSSECRLQASNGLSQRLPARARISRQKPDSHALPSESRSDPAGCSDAQSHQTASPDNAQESDTASCDGGSELGAMHGYYAALIAARGLPSDPLTLPPSSAPCKTKKLSRRATPKIAAEQRFKTGE
jgi:hypothetical protein